MNDNTTPELTDQQIELAKMFNAAAEVFLRLLKEYKLTKPLDEERDFKDVNSLIAEKVAVEVGLVDPLLGPSSPYYHYVSVIKAAAQDLTSDFYQTNSTRKLNSIVKSGEEKIRLQLFIESTKSQDLPITIFKTPHPEFSVPKFPGT